jgi:hypothetical protein
MVAVTSAFIVINRVKKIRSNLCVRRSSSIDVKIIHIDCLAIEVGRLFRVQKNVY